VTKRPPFTDLPTLLAWLNDLSPVDRVRVARVIGDTKTIGAVAPVADAVVYDMTRTASREEVAARLGTSVRAVQRAVSNHIRHGGASRRRGPKAKGEE
jgi:hypothetical protein